MGRAQQSPLGRLIVFLGPLIATIDSYKLHPLTSNTGIFWKAEQTDVVFGCITAVSSYTSPSASPWHYNGRNLYEKTY